MYQILPADHMLPYLIIDTNLRDLGTCLLCMGRPPRWPSVLSLALDGFHPSMKLGPVFNVGYCKRYLLNRNRFIHEWSWDPLRFLGGPEIELHEGKFTIMQDFNHYRLQALNHEDGWFHEVGWFQGRHTST